MKLPITLKEDVMPFARLTIADPGLAEHTQRELVHAITGLLESDLHKEREVVVCHVNLVPAEQWYLATRHAAGATGAHLEVSITAGTNTTEDKAAFLGNAYTAIERALGTLPDAAYVALYELDGQSYGYNGISQTERKRRNPDEKD